VRQITELLEKPSTSNPRDADHGNLLPHTDAEPAQAAQQLRLPPSSPSFSTG